MQVTNKIEPAQSLTSFPLWQKAALFGTAYLFCAWAGSYLSARGGTFISFWLPAGLFVAVLLLNRTRDWPWLLLAAFPANFIFDFFHDQNPNPAVIFFFYCANVIQAFTGAWLVRRFVAEKPTLATLKEFFGLLCFAAIFSTMPGAVIGAATLVHFGLSQSFEQSCKVWWGSNAMAILVFTPFILAWFAKPSAARNVFSPPKKIAEAVLLLLSLIIYVSFLLYHGRGIVSTHRSWAIPLLLWAGLRFGQRGATTAGFFLSLTMAFFTAQFSIGLTPAQVSSGEYVFPMQTVLAMASLVALIPAIVISERDRSLVELRESEERFKNLSAAAFEGIAISENGILMDVNNQFLTMFGFQKRDEVIGRRIIELVAPESREMVTEAIRTGRETIYGHQLLRKDGSVFFAEAQAKMVHIGNRTLRMTALRDVTERKQAEQALRESEEKFSKAFQSNPNGICISEMETGRYIAVNESFCKVFGYSREEMIGHTSLELGIWKGAADRDRLLQPLLTGKSVRDFQMETRDRNNQVKILMVGAELIELGGKQCLVSMLHDITSRVRAEAERAEAQTREMQARATYTLQLIASQEAERTRIARELHDSLGQNLLLIKNHAQLAQLKSNVPAAAREQFEQIGKVAQQAINEVRQISRDLHPYQLDHLGLTRSLEVMIDAAAESSRIVFKHKLDNVDDIFVKDAAMNFYRAVQESLNNILKHSRAKHAQIKLERDVREIELHIEDDGCGFKLEKNDKNMKGLGLKNIAERVRILGGKMKIDSRPGKGTHIKVKIPIGSESELNLASDKTL
jgi:PAS domain S-box-containing protein